MMRAACAALGLALAAVFVVCPQARADEVSYAVVIGNNAAPIGHELRALRFADDDAARFYGVLSRLTDSIELLAVLDAETQKRYPAYAGLARRPTLANLRAALARFQPAMQRDLARGDRPVLYLTFSGHGTLDAQGGGQLALLDEPLTQAVLYDEILASLPDTWTHLIVDACHAGAVVGVRGAFDRELDTTQRALAPSEADSLLSQAPLSRFPYVGALIATAAGQEAHEWQEVESGVFTHEVISALVGAADVNADGRIEYSEVQAFAAAANRTLPDPRAVAYIKVHAPVADARKVIVASSALRDSVRLHAPLSGALGRFHIELSNGQRYAEAHLAEDAPLRLALPAGPERAFLRTQDQEAEIDLRRGSVTLAQLRFEPRSATARGSLDTAYRRHLFESAYGPSYYRGFVDSHGIAGVELNGDRLRTAPGDTRPSPNALAVGLWVAAGAALAVSGVSFALALDRKADFEDTSIERRARELDQDYRTFGTIGLVSLGAAAAALGGGLFVWLSADPDDGLGNASIQALGTF